jgi:hypothetical protein
VRQDHRVAFATKAVDLGTKVEAGQGCWLFHAVANGPVSTCDQALMRDDTVRG